MSLEQISNSVIVANNPAWSGRSTVPATRITYLRALGYQDNISQNLTTLLANNLTAPASLKGLLYVPDIPTDNPCYEQQYAVIPRNVTTKARLPPVSPEERLTFVAIAPWFNTTCTQAYLASVRLDSPKGLIFYRPNNSTRKPQDVNTPVWSLDDDGAWHTENHFPVFAVSGVEGHKMIEQLSLYSGTLSTVPRSDEIIAGVGGDESDYARVLTILRIEDPQNLPAMWTWILIVIGALLFVIACVSLTMHLVQRQRRTSLRRRVISREVDLEAMGIKRMTVPLSHIQSFPVFTYSAQPESVSVPSTPVAARSMRSPRSLRTEHRTTSDVMSSSRTRRSSITSFNNTVATNYQPQCHICLEHYKDRVTVIREAPCGHIFHPQCIDEFLSMNSSLCPICKKNMLPYGYCPRITNGMVRRERAVRKLRERVILDDSDFEDDERKPRKWTKMFRKRTTKHDTSISDTPLTPVTPSKESYKEISTTAGETQPQPPLESHQEEPQDGTDRSDQPQPPAATATAPHSRRQKRQKKPRNLQLQTPNPEEPPAPAPAPAPAPKQGRKSPSALARQRMRTLAGTPVDDPDARRPIWRQAFTKVFPGFG
ncbi:hypothetical protein F5X68DRAFT_269872 [Plectosphaerella plurivora]|uniref:RING-type domain-containing protein n=1 Tax=Plectosphaerella plurivora TaxID=936078 RepID=A0A9P8V702_9PEZI|nr:hypothetical protein F5X68DRAFT_269872 [Plectosphaerella plurivora]